MGTRSRADIRRSIHKRIRKKVKGTSERPRLTVFRSTKHIYAQVIDDVTGTTIASASTVESGFGSGGNVKAAEAVGKSIAERAKEKGVTEVVYDRGGYIYHGRVKALLDATRSAGLNQGSSDGSDAAQAEVEAAEETAEDVNNEE